MFFFSDLRNYWNECNCNVVGIYWIFCQMHGLIIAKLKPNKIIAKMLTGNAVLGLKSDRLDRDWCVSCKVSKASSQTWIKPRVQSGLPQLREFDQSESFLVRDHHLFYTIEYCIFIFLCVCWELIITIRPRVQGSLRQDLAQSPNSQTPSRCQPAASYFQTHKTKRALNHQLKTEQP